MTDEAQAVTHHLSGLSCMFLGFGAPAIFDVLPDQGAEAEAGAEAGAGAGAEGDEAVGAASAGRHRRGRRHRRRRPWFGAQELKQRRAQQQHPPQQAGQPAKQLILRWKPQKRQDHQQQRSSQSCSQMQSQLPSRQSQSSQPQTHQQPAPSQLAASGSGRHRCSRLQSRTMMMSHRASSL